MGRKRKNIEPETPKIQVEAEKIENLTPLLSLIEIQEHDRVDREYFHTMPPGYRFAPTGAELVVHYLKNKVSNSDMPINRIRDAYVYGLHPRDLTSLYKLHREKEWYFFTSRTRKYPNGQRPDRAAGNGFWKATAAEIDVLDGQGIKVGTKRTLVYYEGKPKNKNEAKTNWIMHEYKYFDNNNNNVVGPVPKRNSNGKKKLDDWVLCMIYYKTPNEIVPNQTRPNQVSVGASSPAGSSIPKSSPASSSIPASYPVNSSIPASSQACSPASSSIPASSPASSSIPASYPMHSSYPMQASYPMHSSYPMHASYPMQTSFPNQNLNRVSVWASSPAGSSIPASSLESSSIPASSPMHASYSMQRSFSRQNQQVSDSNPRHGSTQVENHMMNVPTNVGQVPNQYQNGIGFGNNALSFPMQNGGMPNHNTEPGLFGASFDNMVTPASFPVQNQQEHNLDTSQGTDLNDWLEANFFEDFDILMPDPIHTLSFSSDVFPCYQPSMENYYNMNMHGDQIDPANYLSYYTDLQNALQEPIGVLDFPVQPFGVPPSLDDTTQRPDQAVRSPEKKGI